MKGLLALLAGVVIYQMTTPVFAFTTTVIEVVAPILPLALTVVAFGIVWQVL